MKILLVRPPVFSASLDYPQGPRFGVPIGLLYLAASLEAAGHEAAIYDALLDVDLDRPVRGADGRYHIGASQEAFIERLRSEQPDVIGVTNPFADFAEMALWATRAAREALPACTTVIGGPHPTAVPSFFLADDSVNFVIRGEGEASFPALLDCLRRGAAPVSLAGVAGRQRDGTLLSANPPPSSPISTLCPCRPITSSTWNATSPSSAGGSPRVSRSNTRAATVKSRSSLRAAAPSGASSAATIFSWAGGSAPIAPRTCSVTWPC